MPRFVVQAGDHLARIAEAHGYDLDTLYDHPENAELRARRPNPHLLHPGDQVWIPELEPRFEVVATGAMYTFVLRRRAVHLRLVILDPQRSPLAGADWTLDVGGNAQNGTTGADGAVEAEVPANAAEAWLTIDGRTLRLRIGHLNPLDDTADGGASGVRARLGNLGYYGGPADGPVDDELRTAVRRFQRAQGLAMTGELDAALKAELARQHGE